MWNNEGGGSRIANLWRRINKSGGTKNNRKVMGFLSKLAQAFMLPISILPIAGLLLGIGGAIGANVKDPGALDFANFLKGAADYIFGNLAILFGMAVAMAFVYRNAVSAAFMTLVAYLIFNGIQTAFIHYNADAGKTFRDIFYFHTDSDLKYIVGSNLGITSLQTSIFGGILVGAGVAFVMNRWSEIQLPTALNFFSGIRLVPMIIMPFAAALAILFLILWPFVGQAISWFGNVTSRAPGGLDGLVYGVLGRALMPFGLHQIVIGLAFQSSLGGSLSALQVQNAGQTLGIAGTADFQTLVTAINAKPWNGAIVGDQNIWNFINSVPLNRLPVNAGGASQPIFEWFNDHVGIYAGRYTQDYPTYIGACMGIGAAMILMAEKANRKRAATIIGSSMGVAFLTGITEPLEYSFLFVAPLFYYLFYVPTSGLSYMLMKVTGAHVGVGFARGFIDLMIYGAVPIEKGSKFWMAFPLAAGEGLLCFGAFAFAIKRFKWQTPGRGDNKIELITKAKYKQMVAGQGDSSDPELAAYVAAYGGLANLLSVAACATRLRITVKDPALIDKKRLKELGSMGFVEKGAASQNVLGGKANIMASRINKLKE